MDQQLSIMRESCRRGRGGRRGAERVKSIACGVDAQRIVRLPRPNGFGGVPGLGAVEGVPRLVRIGQWSDGGVRSTRCLCECPASVWTAVCYTQRARMTECGLCVPVQGGCRCGEMLEMAELEWLGRDGACPCSYSVTRLQLPVTSIHTQEYVAEAKSKERPYDANHDADK